jgi:hypothetical protein
MRQCDQSSNDWTKDVNDAIPVILALGAILVASMLVSVWWYGQHLKKYEQYLQKTQQQQLTAEVQLGRTQNHQAKTAELLERHERLLARIERLVDKLENRSPPGPSTQS